LPQSIGKNGCCCWGGGGEGIILEIEGNKKITFEWGLGRASNKVEALTLFQGPKLLDASYIRSLIIIEDSTSVIKLMHKTSSQSHGKLTRIVR
jgi:ribonuclease HI